MKATLVQKTLVDKEPINKPISIQLSLVVTLCPMLLPCSCGSLSSENGPERPEERRLDPVHLHPGRRPCHAAAEREFRGKVDKSKD